MGRRGSVFCIKGFLIGFHLLRRWPDDSKVFFFLKYWLKRILRTFPLYYAALGIVVFNLMPYYQSSSVSVMKDFYYHTIFLQDYMGARLLTPLWSLAIEEKFYLFCPILILVLQPLKSNIKLLVILLLCVSVVPILLRLQLFGEYKPGDYSDFFWSFRAPFHMALDGLILGVVAAYIYHYKVMDVFLKKYWPCFFHVAVVLLLILLAVEDWMNMEVWQPTVLLLYIFPLLFSVIVLTSIYSQGVVNVFLSSVWLRLVARLSYSLYICHMLVLPVTEHWFDELQMEVGVLYALAFFMCFISLSLMLSVFLYFTIEKPFLILKDRVSLT